MRLRTRPGTALPSPHRFRSGQGEFSERRQGHRGGTGEVDGPFADERLRHRGTRAVTAVGFPPCGQRPAAAAAMSTAAYAVFGIFLGVAAIVAQPAVTSAAFEGTRLLVQLLLTPLLAGWSI
jgi:hypothetical protein